MELKNLEVIINLNAGYYSQFLSDHTTHVVVNEITETDLKDLHD